MCCFTLLGCNDDLLDKYPVNSLSPSIYWQSVADAESAVNALYLSLPDMTQINMEKQTDLALRPSSAGNDLITGKVTETFQTFQDWWSRYFNGVASANRVIEGLDLIPPANITPEKLSRLKAEARFIRVVSYTFLVNYFGDVPLITKSLQVTEASSVKRTPKQEVMNFIESELSEISNILPASYLKPDIGRITKGAVLAWKARFMLWTKQYQKAADAAKAVMDLNVYSLHPDYASLFKKGAEYANKEVILEYIYSGIRTHDFFSQVAPTTIVAGKSTTLVTNITRALVDAYETVNGLAPANDPVWNIEDPYKNRDPRLYATVWLPTYKTGSYADMLWGQTKLLECRPGSKTKDEVFLSSTGDVTGFYIKKYTVPEDVAAPTLSSQNFVILRYADVLLMYAEAKIELGQIDATVIQAINSIRQRPGVNLPTLQAKGVNVTSQSEMRSAVRQERLVELAMEGWRFYDIRRWDIASEIMKDSKPVPGMYYSDIKTNERKEILVSFCLWNFPKKNSDYTFPVPWKESNMNPNLLPQNQGW